MYAWLWRTFPGNRWWKTLQALVLFTSLVVILFFAVFPALEPYLPGSAATVGP